MRRPEWIKGEDEIVDCLLRVRDVGVWDLRLHRIAIEPLEAVARAICPEDLHNDQHRLIEQAMTLAIAGIDQGYRKAATILFDLGEVRIKSATDRRRTAGDGMNQGLSRFRDPQAGYERPIIKSVAQSLQRLAARQKTAEAENPLEALAFAGVQPEQLVAARGLFHVARTLEVSRRYAYARAAETIGSLLSRYLAWHREPSGDVQDMLLEFDSACRRYLGFSVYELLGEIADVSPGPDTPPYRPVPRLQYQGSGSLIEVPGGLDPFTREVVEPFYIAYFPVTAREWREFLVKFKWHGVGYYANIEELVADRVVRDSEADNVPAVGMSYYDCLAYCFWLWLTTAYRFRLPTEAEWNFAATGGSRLAYPWGDGMDHTIANVAVSGKLSRPVSVDTIPPSGPFRVSGLSGNTWEYVSTLWRGESPVPDSDLVVPDLIFPLINAQWWQTDSRLSVTSETYLEDVRVVMKGGSWGLGEQYATVATRIYSSLHNSGEYGGFRLAISAVQDATGAYVPEPSPFVYGHLHEVQPKRINDLRKISEDVLRSQIHANSRVNTCGFGDSEEIKPWEEIARERRARR